MTVDAFVLAGGRSTRMGQDKAFVRLEDGSLMLQKVLQTVCSASPRVSLVRRRGQADVEDLDLSPSPAVIVDMGGENAHPLWGLETALRHSSTEYALVMPCDVPMVPPSFLQTLIERRNPNGVIAVSGQEVHPLIGIYPASMADRAREGARHGLSMRAFSQACVRLQGSPEWFRNVNAPADLP